MGGIAAGTQPGALPGHHDEPDIDMPEPSTPASEDSDSDETEGNSIYFPSKAKGALITVHRLYNSCRWQPFLDVHALKYLSAAELQCFTWIEAHLT
jgi:hypothetical protein